MPDTRVNASTQRRAIGLRSMYEGLQGPWRDDRIISADAGTMTKTRPRLRLPHAPA